MKLKSYQYKVVLFGLKLFFVIDLMSYYLKKYSLTAWNALIVLFIFHPRNIQLIGSMPWWTLTSRLSLRSSSKSCSETFAIRMRKVTFLPGHFSSSLTLTTCAPPTQSTSTPEKSKRGIVGFSLSTPVRLVVFQFMY